MIQKPNSILVFDIDGTLTERNQTKILPEKLPLLLNELDKLGHFSIPATGKPLAYVTRVFTDNKLEHRGIIAENAGVYQVNKDNPIVVFGENLQAIFQLKKLIGLKPKESGRCKINLNGSQYEVIIDPEDHSIITIFSESKHVQHRWEFKGTADRYLVHSALKSIIEKSDLNTKLALLDPFPDGAIQVIRKDMKGNPIDKSCLTKVVKDMYQLSTLLPIAMFGDGHNDIPAMKPEGVIPITFQNAEKPVKDFVQRKNGFVTPSNAINGPGIIEGIEWLARHTDHFDQNITSVLALIKRFFS